MAMKNNFTINFIHPSIQLSSTIFIIIILAFIINSSDAYLMELVIEPVFEYSKSGIFSIFSWWTSSISMFNSLAGLISNPATFFLTIRWDRIFNFFVWSGSAAVSVFMIYRLKIFLFDPINRVRLLGEVGYHHEVGSSDISSGGSSSSCGKNSAVVDAVRKRRKTGGIPPVFPNGWFALLESRDLKHGEAKSFSCLGLNLAIFRGESGAVHVLDAYCPHMGANLAVGGVVKKDCLECPFHGWQFRGDDGKCVHVPYCDDKHIPDSASVNSYCSLERNGVIFLWFHAEGLDPLWEPPDIEEVTKGVWKYCGRSEHIVNSHIEEIPENGADVAHLKQVHGPIMTAGIDLSRMQNRWWSFARHDWMGNWSPSTESDKKHIGRLDLVHRIVIFGKHVSILDLNVTALQIGPGLVHLHFDSPIFGKGIFIQTLTPIEPLLQRVVHNVYINQRCPTIVAKFFLFGEALMVERDIMIWNNKQYASKPLLLKSKEDALVARHRRWYSQFYSEHSPRLAPKIEDW